MKKIKSKNIVSWVKKNPISVAIYTIALGMFVWYIYPYVTPVIEMEEVSINQVTDSSFEPTDPSMCSRRKFVCSSKTTVKIVGGSRRLVRQRQCRCVPNTIQTETTNNKVICQEGQVKKDNECLTPISPAPNPPKLQPTFTPE